MSKPCVSVLIDTYNHEHFIAQAIASVLDQDMAMEEVEIVVVDDGSADRTPEIVRGFEPRVRLLRKTNGGQASAFNAGIAECHGEIIAFLDGDDWWAPGKLRRVLEEMERNPEVGIVGHGFYEVNSDGRPSGLIVPGDVYRVDLSTREGAEVFRHLATFLGTSRMTVRCSALKRILPIPEELKIEADEYIFTLASALAPALILNEPLFYYRLHAGNLYQFAQYEVAKARRKMDVLEVLVRDLPPKLREVGVQREAIDIILCATRVEIERARLALDGGSPLRTFKVERTGYRIAYSKVTWRHRIFQAFVLSLTLLFPPRFFYRLRRIYAERGLSRFRAWTGSPVPAIPIVERRPDLPNR